VDNNVVIKELCASSLHRSIVFQPWFECCKISASVISSEN